MLPEQTDISDGVVINQISKHLKLFTCSHFEITSSRGLHVSWAWPCRSCDLSTLSYVVIR